MNIYNLISNNNERIKENSVPRKSGGKTENEKEMENDGNDGGVSKKENQNHFLSRNYSKPFLPSISKSLSKENNFQLSTIKITTGL